MEVLLTTVTPVAGVPPKLTVAPARKPVPVMVTAVPPSPFLTRAKPRSPSVGDWILSCK